MLWIVQSRLDLWMHKRFLLKINESFDHIHYYLGIIKTLNIQTTPTYSAQKLHFIFILYLNSFSVFAKMIPLKCPTENKSETKPV